MKQTLNVILSQNKAIGEILSKSVQYFQRLTRSYIHTDRQTDRDEKLKNKFLHSIIFFECGIHSIYIYTSLSLYSILYPFQSKLLHGQKKYFYCFII